MELNEQQKEAVFSNASCFKVYGREYSVVNQACQFVHWVVARRK